MSPWGIPEFNEYKKKKGWEGQKASLGNLSDILYSQSPFLRCTAVCISADWESAVCSKDSPFWQSILPFALISQSENQRFNFLSASCMLLCVSHHPRIAASLNKESGSSTPPLYDLAFFNILYVRWQL